MKAMLSTGTHNAGMYHLEKSLGLSPDADDALKSFTSLPLFGPMAMEIIGKWSKTQNLSIAQQLEAGVRYFDLRVGWGGPDGDLYIVHSLFGPKVWDCIEDICVFLQNHPREVVLLDFNHFYNMETEHHLQLITFIISKLQSNLCPVSLLEQTTLVNFWGKQQQTIVFYQHELVQEFRDLWPATSIASPWASTTNVDDCLVFQEKFAKQRHTEGKFYVCQLVLTPSTPFILQNIGNDLLHACACKINPRISSWIQSCSMKGHTGCIYAVDFVEMDHIIESIIQLNV